MLTTGIDWCDQEDMVPEGDRIYHCSKCRKRLHPPKIFGADGEVVRFKLPKKTNGHEIRAVKDRHRKIRTGRKCLE